GGGGGGGRGGGEGRRRKGARGAPGRPRQQHQRARGREGAGGDEMLAVPAKEGEGSYLAPLPENIAAVDDAHRQRGDAEGAMEHAGGHRLHRSAQALVQRDDGKGAAAPFRFLVLSEYLAAALTTPSRRPRAGCFRRAGITSSRT